MSDSFRLDADGNLRSQLLEQFEWLRHGFGTRTGALPPFPLATVKQIHSATILDAGGSAGVQGEADALIGSSAGLAVGVKTADCVPILLVDPIHHVVAAVHAGWRGTVAEIAALTVRRMTETHDSKASELFAAIGPAIGPCCYEVGPEVARAFAKWDWTLASVDTKTHLDLESVNFAQLQLSGLSGQKIARAQTCTRCGIDTYFSFRMEGEKAGRMMSWIVAVY